VIVKKTSNVQALIIFGPTGAGKTDLALRIAEHTPAEIVNMNVGQFYTPLSIGTAKPEKILNILKCRKNCHSVKKTY